MKRSKEIEEPEKISDIANELIHEIWISTLPILSREEARALCVGKYQLTSYPPAE